MVGVNPTIREAAVDTIEDTEAKPEGSVARATEVSETEIKEKKIRTKCSSATWTRVWTT